MAYWATDQGSWNQNGPDGVLYQCTAPNVWSKYDEPYTYPHPLRSGKRWLISGEHYYRLEKLSSDSTRLLHGEYFRGWGSVFIGESTLTKMVEAFRLHNLLLKERVGNG
jgi:hypothetical protein